MTGKDEIPIGDDDLDQLVGQLQSEEEAARKSRLGSIESLRQWLLETGSLSHIAQSTNFAQYAPALLQMLQRLLGV
ncbi:MAG: hypothetical protein GC150_11785 [Rhizobiales bacterium]|nr:hypothetical protein [Hyphomicrobiales bacterium]